MGSGGQEVRRMAYLIGRDRDMRAILDETWPDTKVGLRAIQRALSDYKVRSK